MIDYHMLSTIPLFQGISEQDLSSVLSCLQAKTKEYEKNQIVFLEGSSAEDVGIVLSGSILIQQEDYFGNRNILTTIKAAGIFGEVFSCADIPSLPVNIIASEPSEILLVNCKKIHTICSNSCEFHNQLIHNLLYIIARKNLEFKDKIDIISQRTTKEKLMYYLLTIAKQKDSMEFTIPYDRQSLADYLGVERSALSTEISKLCKEGCIETKKNWFRLVKSST